MKKLLIAAADLQKSDSTALDGVLKVQDELVAKSLKTGEALDTIEKSLAKANADNEVLRTELADVQKALTNLPKVTVAAAPKERLGAISAATLFKSLAQGNNDSAPVFKALAEKLQANFGFDDTDVKKALTPGDVLGIDVDNVVWDNLAQYKLVPEWVTERPVSTKTTRFPLFSAAPTATFFEDTTAGTIATSDVTSSNVTIAIKRAGVIVYIPVPTIQDSPADIVAAYYRALANSIYNKSESMCTIANGTTDTGGVNGGFTGIFANPLAASTTTLATGQASATLIKYTDLVGMKRRMPAWALQRKGLHWVANPQIAVALDAIMDGFNRPALRSPNFNSTFERDELAPELLLGIPVSWAASAPTDAASTVVLALTHKESNVFALRKGVETLSTYEGGNAFASYSLGIRSVVGVGFGIRDQVANQLLKTSAT